MAADDYLQMSGLQHFCFCRRQWALIHLEQQWSENQRTAEGRLLHERCHDDALREKRGDLLTVRGMRVVSHRLRLAGACDVVEFHADPAGVPLQGQPGLWLPLPVEYKHGAPKQNDADRLQLCAQAMALEEMLVCEVPRGALFYAETRRREWVDLTPELRQKTQQMADEMNDYFAPRLHAQGQAGQTLQRLLAERAVPARALPPRRCRRIHPGAPAGGRGRRRRMRKLLNTLFVLTESSYLTLDGENVVVSQDRTETARFALHTLEGILCFSYPGASPALMGACAQRGVDLAFFTPRGRFLARAVGETRGNVLLRQQQYRAADDPGVSCRYAKGFLLGKVYNARWVLERATRDPPPAGAGGQAQAAVRPAGRSAAPHRGCHDNRGTARHRGEAAKLYFDGFDDLILQQRPDFAFAGRSRRPPLDPRQRVCSRLRIRCWRATAPPRWKALAWTRMWASCTVPGRAAPAWRLT